MLDKTFEKNQKNNKKKNMGKIVKGARIQYLVPPWTQDLN